MDHERTSRWLWWAGAAFAVGSAVHVVDHLRRGQGSISDGLYYLGNLALVLQVVVVTLVLTRHRLAPIAAASTGFVLAAGFAGAHWLPEWSSLSDPIWEIESWTWFSYVASSAEVLGALAVGIAGAAEISARGLASFASTRDHPEPARSA